MEGRGVKDGENLTEGGPPGGRSVLKQVEVVRDEKKNAEIMPRSQNTRKEPGESVNLRSTYRFQKRGGGTRMGHLAQSFSL